MKPSLLVLLAGLLALPSIRPAGERACDCGAGYQGRQRIINELKRAVVVFAGEVTLDHIETVTFKVTKVWKGKIEPEVTMRTGALILPGGQVQSSTCDYRFRMGRQYLVFAYGPTVREMGTNSCSPTAELERAKETVAFLDDLTSKGGGLGWKF